MSDKQLIRYATAFRKGVLGTGPSVLACMMVSAPLSSLLGIAGVPNTLEEVALEDDGHLCANHVFLRLSDGRVLDPTADQFNGCGAETYPPVYLGAPKWFHIAQPAALREGEE